MRKSLYDYCRETGETALLDEWARDENGFGPENVSYGSKVKCWWRCAGGHLYQASITSRTNEHTGCPYCSGRVPVPGENDLATLYPRLAAEWDTEKNGAFTPRDVLPGSHRYAWWKCSKGHSWRAAVKSRVAGTGCPVCAGRELSPGENDLATASPRLAAEWDTEKNGALTPRDVFPSSGRKVWWRCSRGHEWLARVSARSQGAGCPYCSGKLVMPGFNDLASIKPKLAAEWHPTLNAPLTPEQVTVYSNRKVWWQCPRGHEYKAVVSSRSSANSGCPYCANRLVMPGFNDLATQEPRIAREWAQDMNGALTPEMVTTGSRKKVWWRCPEGHVWRAVVFTRARGRHSGCPVCAGRVKTGNRSTYTRVPRPDAGTKIKEENRV